MDHSTCVMRRPRRVPNGARTAAAIIATAGLALLAAACSSSPASTGASDPSTAGASTTSPSAVAYSDCIRSHGVPSFPDPSGNGQVPKASAQQLGVSSSQLQAAQTACQHLYPNSGGSGVLTKDAISACEETGNCSQPLVQQAMTALRAYARCMRAHGVPNWPDPTIDSEGRPGVNLVAVPGNTDWNGARISNIMQECQYTMPNNVPVPVIAPGTAG